MSSLNSFSKLINGELPILIDFHATWCGPCKALAPAIKEVAHDLKGEVRVIKIDIDKNQSLATQLNVRGVPTLMLYRDGDMLWRESGVMPANQIKQIIQSKIV